MFLGILNFFALSTSEVGLLAGNVVALLCCFAFAVLAVSFRKKYDLMDHGQDVQGWLFESQVSSMVEIQLSPIGKAPPNGDGQLV